MSAGGRLIEALREHPLARFRPGVWWGDQHRRARAQPVFAGCSRDEIRRIVRWSDEVEVAAGEVLLRQDTIGYWFLVVVEGRLELTRNGAPVAVIGAGAHVGDTAILGFGPQPATATALTRCRLIVLGRRHLLSLADGSAAVRTGLRPDLDEASFRRWVRDLRRAADVDWRSLPHQARPRASDPERALPWARVAGTRRTGGGPGPFSDLVARAFRPSAGAGLPAAPANGPTVGGRRRALAALCTSLVLVMVAVALWWRPPVMVVAPAAAVDVTGDVELHPPPGRAPPPASPITGRYLLTAVDVRQPTLAGLAVALLEQRRTLPRLAGDEERAARNGGRASFAAGQARATALAATLAGGTGVDPDAEGGVEVTFAERDILGSSAGLVYALVVIDLLSPEDLARGRRIAATGEIDEAGRVLPVAFVAEKLRGARAAGADLILVPSGQGQKGNEGEPTAVHEVASVADAVAVLRR